jgi:hypothetical protein
LWRDLWRDLHVAADKIFLVRQTAFRALCGLPCWAVVEDFWWLAFLTETVNSAEGVCGVESTAVVWCCNIKGLQCYVS